MNIERMKEINALAQNQDNLRLQLNDIIFQGKGMVQLAKEIGIEFKTLKKFLLQDKLTQHVPRMKMAKYCISRIHENKQ